MSTLKQFMKANKKAKENIFYPATESLTDEKGKPLKWELKAITTKENNRLTSDCMYAVPVVGKPREKEEKLDTEKYLVGLVVAATVFPNLHDAELQDSYGVKSAEELVLEILDNPAEFTQYIKAIQDHNGFNTMDEKVEEAKN